MQLVPRTGRAEVPVKPAEHGKQRRELAEQGGTGKGQRRFVSVAGHVVGHLLPGLGLAHLPAHRLAVGTGTQDDAGRLEPRFVGCGPAGGHPEIAGAAEIGAEGLPGTPGQIMLFGGGQLQHSLSQPPAAGRAEVRPGPGVGVGSPDA